MTLTLEGLGPPANLRLRDAVLGIDPSTLRMSAGILVPDGAGVPECKWSTVTLQRHDHLAMRQTLAHVAIVGWLRQLEASYGPFLAVGLEEPLARGTVHRSSFYVIGALLCALGEVLPGVELVSWEPMSWKLAATGSGYAPGLPRSASRADKRKGELARLEAWARDACGWTGTVQDESAGLGVATATGVKLCRRA